MTGILSDTPGRDHPIRRVDGRLKLLSAVAMLGLVLSCKGFLLPSVLMIVAVILCIYLKIPVRLLFLRCMEPLAVISVLILIKLFFSGKEPLFCLSLGGMQVTGYREGLFDGLLMAARIGGALSIVSLLSFTTPFTDLISALSWCRVPKGITETLMFAYRYLFMLSDEATVIYCAQKNRLGYSSIRRGVSSFGILAGSLTLRALEHSQATAAAMAQRGYDGTGPVIRLKPPALREILGSLVCVAAAVCVWMVG